MQAPGSGLGFPLGCTADNLTKTAFPIGKAVFIFCLKHNIRKHTIAQNFTIPESASLRKFRSLFKRPVQALYLMTIAGDDHRATQMA